ncbi:hypothetical protein LY78DRAFT_40311 [Colletotrichum sublineola]|nr:hypothetical protein LY78DRAFT_40311 [Colletotrichum sublineola]
MPEGRVCCSNGGNCNEGAACTADGLCSDSKADGPNCDPGTAACGSRCMPADAVCCEGGNYCDAGQTCVEDGSYSGGDDNRTTSGTSKPTPTGFGNFVIETVVGAAPTTTSASAGAPRGVYVNHAALAVGLCAAVPLGI